MWFRGTAYFFTAIFFAALVTIAPASALGALLILLTRFFGVPGNPRRPGFWQTPLYASAAWTFSDSWATNITAIATVVTAGLAATSGISAVLPGVDLGRFSLMIALAGGITVVAPLVFGTLNSWLQAVDPATTGIAEVWLPTGRSAIDVPAGTLITVAPPADVAVGWHNVLTLPGTTDIVVAPGKRISVSTDWFTVPGARGSPSSAARP